MREREVPVLQLLEVAEHLRLAPVAVEVRVRHELGRARERAVVARFHLACEFVGCEARRGGAGERHQQVVHVVDPDGLVEGNPERAVTEIAEVDAELVGGALGDVGGFEPAGGADAERVEVVVVDDLVADPAQPAGEELREAVDALGDGFEPLGSVVDGVHRRDNGEEDLGRADVARRLLAADVLLARLQRHP